MPWNVSVSLLWLSKKKCKYSSERSEHREWSTVVDISTPPPSFKSISLYFSRFPLSKTPKEVFFNPINYIWTSHYYQSTFFVLTFKIIFLQVERKSIRFVSSKWRERFVFHWSSKPRRCGRFQKNVPLCRPPHWQSHLRPTRLGRTPLLLYV